MPYITPKQRPGETTEEFIARLEKITADTEELLNRNHSEEARQKTRRRQLIIYGGSAAVILLSFLCVIAWLSF